MHINFLEETSPGCTTLLKFRHLLEEHKIGAAIFDDIKVHLEDAGLIFHVGTIVDASIMEAPSSTRKNEEKERDPENASNPKGRSVAFRQESKNRHRCAERLRAHAHRDIRERPRYSRSS